MLKDQNKLYRRCELAEWIEVARSKNTWSVLETVTIPSKCRCCLTIPSTVSFWSKTSTIWMPCSCAHCHLMTLLYWIFQAIRTLSCEARNQKIYVVVNIPEVAPCANSSSNCAIYYNSNVVFDRKGTIVARWVSSLIMFISITHGTASVNTTYIDVLALILML